MDPTDDAHRRDLVRRLAERTGEPERVAAFVLEEADYQVSDAEDCLIELAGWLGGDDEEDERSFVRYWIQSERTVHTKPAWHEGRLAALADIAKGTFCELVSGLLAGNAMTATCPACLSRRDYPVHSWLTFELPPCEACGRALVPLRSTGCVVEEDTSTFTRGYNDTVEEHLRAVNPAFRWRDLRKRE